MKRRFPVLIFLLMAMTAFTYKKNIVVSNDADLILKVRILELGPAVVWNWGVEQRSVICSPLKMYKGILPDTVSTIGFSLETEMNMGNKNSDETLLPVKLGKEYVIFLTKEHAGECYYFGGDKHCPMYMLSGTNAKSILVFSDSLETQLEKQIK